jgi:tetratricopeptide (TPR) repeat protein
LSQPPDPANTAQFEPLYRAELAAKGTAFGKTDARTLQAVRDLALFLKGHESTAEARALLRRLAETKPTAADLLALAELSEPGEALPLLERAVSLEESGEARWRLGSAYAAAQQLDKAKAEYQRAAAIWEKEANPKVGVAWNDLGFLAETQERFPEAEGYYRKALGAHQKRLGLKDPEVATAMNNLGSVVGAQGRLPEAEGYIRKALALFEETLGNAHERTASCAANLADLLTATGRAAAARPLYERAMKTYEQLGQREAAADIRARMGQR